MYLYEVDKESKIQILVGIGMQVLEFDSKVMDIVQGGILAEPVMKDDKILGFRTKGLVIRLLVVNQTDQKVYEFNNVSIQNIKTAQEELFHRITGRFPGKAVNRRNGCRVWLGLDGVAQIGMNKTAYDVVIRDISINGIAFVCQESIQVEMGTVVHLTFFDDVTETRFSIGAIVVRREEAEQYKVIYGCKLNQESAAISKYVNEKQREKLRATRTVGGGTIPLEKRK